MNSLFRQELGQLINKYSMENESNTPDFILAQYLEDCMTSFALAVSATSKWKNEAYVNPQYIQADGAFDVRFCPDKIVQVGPVPKP